MIYSLIYAEFFPPKTTNLNFISSGMKVLRNIKGIYWVQSISWLCPQHTIYALICDLSRNNLSEALFVAGAWEWGEFSKQH